MIMISKTTKYFISIAIIKILLAYLVMQIFFTSCESFYDNDVYSEGPIVEIPATFGTDRDVFGVGDTVYLDINIDDLNIKNELLKGNINVSNSTFNVRIAFKSDSGDIVYPEYFLSEGKNISIDGESYWGTFTSLDTVPVNFRAGFIFKKSGKYIAYFVNTPNTFVSEGSTDIIFNNELSAYAIYLFNTGKKTIDYALDKKEYNVEILNQASFDQAIKDFTVFVPEEK